MKQIQKLWHCTDWLTFPNQTWSQPETSMSCYCAGVCRFMTISFATEMGLILHLDHDPVTEYLLITWIIISLVWASRSEQQPNHKDPSLSYFSWSFRTPAQKRVSVANPKIIITSWVHLLTSASSKSEVSGIWTQCFQKRLSSFKDELARSWEAFQKVGVFFRKFSCGN